MPAVSPARVTRQKAVGRFRAARLDRRADDLEQRQKMLLSVAERVLQIVDETQRQLAHSATSRQDWGDRLRTELTRGHLNLSETTTQKLARSGEIRRAAGEHAHRDRQDFMERLRTEVVRIVSEDFL